MTAASKFGLLLGVMLVGLDRIGSPMLWVSFWAALAIFLDRGARVTWQRTGLWWLTVAKAYGAIECAALVVVYALGYTLLTMPYVWRLVLWGNVAVLAVMQFVAARENRDKWRRLSEHEEHSSFVDVLLVRHIPNLR
jgi:hypothetical protein